MLGDNRRKISLSDCRIMAQRSDGWGEVEVWVRKLQTAIVKQAVDDLRAAIRAGETGTAASLGKWFLSEWGQLLCFGQGAYIVEKVIKEEAIREQRNN